jgi:ParB-like chromosome segregation protein Spo0J
MVKIKLSDIVEKIQVRDIQENIVQDIKRNIEEFGYKENFPLLLRKFNGKYKLIDGNHRVKALEELRISEAAVKIIEEEWPPEREEKEAWDCNKASETSAKATFIDHAEYIWKKAEAGLTQEKIGEVLGWNISKIKQYSALKSIDEKVWKEIVTTFQGNNKLHSEECVTEKVTVVTFSERILIVCV